ncbi:MAG: hypothetical protein ACJAWZ_001785, partial [Paracoccaceae bacterium]
MGSGFSAGFDQSVRHGEDSDATITPCGFEWIVLVQPRMG